MKEVEPFPLSKEFGFWETIKLDLCFYRRKFYDVPSDGKNLSFLVFLKSMLSPCFALVFWYRVYSRLFNSNSRFLSSLGMFLYYRVVKKYSSDISPACKIGVPFKVGHHMGIVIGGRVRIGAHSYIFNDVTLGNKNVGLPDDKMPVIGDRVIVGTGAKLLGDISIGDDCLIGANSLVVCSTGNREKWAGVPAIKLRD